MLIDPKIEKLLPLVNNRHLLALLTAKRARQLIDGAQPMVEQAEKGSVVTHAAKEIAAGAVRLVHGHPEEVTIPIRPEVQAARLEAERLERSKTEEGRFEEIAVKALTGSSVGEEPREGLSDLWADQSSPEEIGNFTQNFLRMIQQGNEEIDADLEDADEDLSEEEFEDSEAAESEDNV